MVEFNKFAVGRVECGSCGKTAALSQEVFSGLVGIARSHLAMIESWQHASTANFETVWAHCKRL